MGDRELLHNRHHHGRHRQEDQSRPESLQFLDQEESCRLIKKLEHRMLAAHIREEKKLEHGMLAVQIREEKKLEHGMLAAHIKEESRRLSMELEHGMLVAHIIRKVEKVSVGVIMEKDRGLRLVPVQKLEVRDVKLMHHQISDVKREDQLMKREKDKRQRLEVELGRRDREIASQMMSFQNSYEN